MDIRRTYTDGQILFAADLDAVVDDIETFLNTTKINDDNIQNQGITASTKLVDASITTGKIASSAVTTPKIADANITTPKIADEAVTRAKIDDIERIPVGAIMQYGGSSAPAGWLMGGQNVSRTTYATLFALLSTTYGAGDGSTTFGLPGKAGRKFIAAGTSTEGLTTRTAGGVGGEETHTLTATEMPTHTHVQDAHTHGLTVYDGAGDTTGISGLGYINNQATNPQTLVNTQSTTATNQSAGSGAAHNNMDPWEAVYVIVKY